MEQPMQPVEWVGDVIRFRANPIVRYLLDRGPYTMNDIARLGFSPEDQRQFAQLIGYSVSGYGDLSYADEKSVAKADALAAALHAKRL